MTQAQADAALQTVVRAEWGRLVALLLARHRRLDLVEDALADAVEAAARRWGEQGVPDNPAAWLLTAARRRVVGGSGSFPVKAVLPPAGRLVSASAKLAGRCDGREGASTKTSHGGGDGDADGER